MDAMPVADAGLWDPGGGGVEERLRVAAGVDRVRGRRASTPASVGGGAGDLDPKTGALVRLAALVALGSSAACYQELVCAAVELGATEQEVIDTMIAVALDGRHGPSRVGQPSGGPRPRLRRRGRVRGPPPGRPASPSRPGAAGPAEPRTARSCSAGWR